MESLGEKRKRLKAQRAQATMLLTELAALGYAAGMFTRKGAVVLKCAKGLGAQTRGAVLTWDAEGFTAEVWIARVPVMRTGSVSEVLGKLRWLSSRWLSSLSVG